MPLRRRQQAVRDPVKGGDAGQWNVSYTLKNVWGQGNYMA